MVMRNEHRLFPNDEADGALFASADDKVFASIAQSQANAPSL
jgi:hypothetical protein